MITILIYIPYSNTLPTFFGKAEKTGEKYNKFNRLSENVSTIAHTEIEPSQKVSSEFETPSQFCLNFQINSLTEESCKRYQKSIQNLIDLLEIRIGAMPPNEKGDEYLMFFSPEGEPVPLMEYNVYNRLEGGYFLAFYRKLLSEAHLYAKKILSYYFTEESIKNNRPKSDDETFIIQIQPCLISKFITDIFKSWSIQTDFLMADEPGKEKIYIEFGVLEIVALVKILHMYNTNLKLYSSEEAKIEYNSDILLGKYYSFVDKKINSNNTNIALIPQESEKFKKIYLLHGLDFQIIKESIDNFSNTILKKEAESNFSINNTSAFYKSSAPQEASSKIISTACTIS